MDHFVEIWKRNREITALECYHYQMLGETCLSCLSLPGDVVELGVYRGGSALLLAEVLEGSDKTLHLFDTFVGLDALPEFKNTSLAEVMTNLQGTTIPILYHVGDVAKTLPAKEPREICFAHLDMDLYLSTIHACRMLWPKIVPGGVILFDDYGFVQYVNEAKRAIDEFASEMNLKIERFERGCQAYLQKV